MDCGRTSISLSPEEQLPVFRGRLSRIRESDGVLPHSYFGANSRTAEFQHSHLEDIAQKHAMLTNSRIRVGEHRRIAISATSSGRTPPKKSDRPELPDSNGKHHSADQSAQISPPAPSARRHRQQTTPHRRRARKPHRSAAHQPTAPQPPTAAPPASRDSGSARAAGSIRRTPAATPVRRWPGRACPQQGTASRTRTRKTQSQAHR